MSDDELLDLLRRDPEKGLKALIAKFGGLVYTVVRRNLPEAFCAADIEACAADVFAEAYLDLEKFDPTKACLKAWICVIARHNAADLARRSNIALPLDEEREMRRAVLSEIKSLGEPDREILLRKIYLGESSKETAARLKMSVSNVDTRTSRAIEKLRKKFDDWRN